MGKWFWKVFQVEFEDNWKPKRSSIDTKEWADTQQPPKSDMIDVKNETIHMS